VNLGGKILIWLRPEAWARRLLGLWRVPRLEDLTSETERAFCLRELEDARKNCGFVALSGFFRWRLMLGMVRSIGRPLRILDVGCAFGDLALELAEAGHEVVASDLRGEVLEYSKRRYRRGSIRWVCANAEKLPFARVFDLVILGELVEHAAHPDRILSSAASVVTPGGHLLITTPNWHCFSNRLPSYGQTGDAGELESKQYRPDGDGHLFLFKAGELEALVRKAGLQPGPVRYHSSPFANGSAKFRYVGRYLPVGILQFLEGVVRRLPRVRSRLCSGLTIVARVPN